MAPSRKGLEGLDSVVKLQSCLRRQRRAWVDRVACGASSWLASNASVGAHRDVWHGSGLDQEAKVGGLDTPAPSVSAPTPFTVGEMWERLNPF